jgi:hypothetical protein
MKKPINRFSLVLWVLAAIFIIANVPMYLAIQQLGREIAASQGAAMGNFSTLTNAWYEFRTALLGAGQIAALGMLIELVDQIRWNAISKSNVGSQ